MSNRNKIKWLLHELDILKQKDIITSDVKTRISEYYQDKLKPVNLMNTVFIVLGIASGLLILGGIILILVIYNLFILTKEVKTVGAFLLLLVPQGLCIFTLITSKKTVAKKEIFSILLAVTSGLSIAFIGQIYQLSSNFANFLLVWAGCVIVIIYIFDSLSSMPVYLMIIISLSSYYQIEGSIGLMFYPMFALLIPFMYLEYKKESQVRKTVINYFVMVSLIAALGITLEKSVPGLWIVSYANLFGLFYLVGKLLSPDDESLFSRPFVVGGIAGIGIFIYLLSYHWPWDEIGWSYYRTDLKFNDLASGFDYIISLLLPGLNVFLIFLCLKKKKVINFVVSLAGFIILALYILISAIRSLDDVAAWVMNLYIFALFFYTIFNGYKNRSLLEINLGLLLFFTTLITRFFDSDMSALIRGLAFLATGITMLVVNLNLMKKFKKGSNK